ncbi:MAG: hypothetical protein P4L84_16030 [Isosphaeraceae bacterium]|nr:hypothetical protein [Isosphaeraceae bacterium]
MSDQTQTTDAPATPPAEPATTTVTNSDPTPPPADTSSAPSSAPSKRFEWGPEFAGDYETHESDPPNGRPDVELSLIPPDDAAKKTGEIHLDLPAHNPAEHNAPERVYLICYPPGAAVHTNPADAVASNQPQSFVDVPPSPGGAEIVLPRPQGVRKHVKHQARVILQFPE